MKFIHAADLHIDSALRGLEKLEEAPVEEIRRAPREAFRRLVQLAQDEAVDFVLLAGDTFDQDWRDARSGAFFSAQINALNPIPVFIIRGNHDAGTDLLKRLRAPNAFIFSHRRPETRCLDGLGVAIHGQSYKSRAVYDDLASNYPKPLKDYVNIGVLHTCLEGYAEHERYAPCAVAALASHGYDYWALGHIHAQQIVNEDPLIVFPGNLQGRHIRETGPKGCYLVSDADGVWRAQFQEMDVVRWFDESVDVSEATDADAAIDMAARLVTGLRIDHPDRLLCVRVELTGSTTAHRELTLTQAIDDHLRSQLPSGAWLVDLRIRTSPVVDLDKLRAQDDVQGALFRALKQFRADPTAEVLQTLLKPLREKLPPDVVDTYGIRLDDPQILKSAIEGAERILLAEMAQTR